MLIKETEPIVNGNPRPKTRSRVIELPDGAVMPEGAVETTEPVRDWQEDE